MRVIGSKARYIGLDRMCPATLLSRRAGAEPEACEIVSSSLANASNRPLVTLSPDGKDHAFRIHEKAQVLKAWVGVN